MIDKVKDLLPFQTLPLFELAQDNANLGPNEVSKDVIKDVGENVKEGVDTAAPGEARRWTCMGSSCSFDCCILVGSVRGDRKADLSHLGVIRLYCKTSCSFRYLVYSQIIHEGEATCPAVLPCPH